jgi:hypothetical protein
LRVGKREALRDEALRDTTREIFRLPVRERLLVLEIVQQFAGAESVGGTRPDSGKSVDRGVDR